MVRSRPRRSVRVLVGLVGLGLIGAPTAASTPAPEVQADGALHSDPAAGCAQTTLEGMSLAQRVGQLFMVGIGSTLDGAERSLIRDAHIGSVTFAARIAGGRS